MTLPSTFPVLPTCFLQLWRRWKKSDELRSSRHKLQCRRNELNQLGGRIAASPSITHSIVTPRLKSHSSTNYLDLLKALVIPNVRTARLFETVRSRRLNECQHKHTKSGTVQIIAALGPMEVGLSSSVPGNLGLRCTARPKG